MSKMTKKLQKNLQDSKKSSIFAPELVFETCSSVPCANFKPKEAMSIREMLIRTERGQRLDIHTRFRADGVPDNMYPFEYDNQGRTLPDKNEDTFEHTPPDGMADIVDVMRYQEDLNERREALKAERAKSVANAPKAEPKKEDKPEPAKVPGAVTKEEA